MTTLARTLDLLDRLIRFDTTSRLSNLELVEWVEGFLRPSANHVQRLPNVQGDKANLWVRIGPDAPGGLILSGHTDVVPVDGQPWTSDPFVLTRREDRLYGRGTSDMKAFIALCLAFAQRFAGAPLRRPVHFAFSYDEEIGCKGVPDMVEAIAAAANRPSMAWIGEPTEWGVVSGHKGVVTFEVDIVGLEAHSSLPHAGASAVHEAVDLMAILRSIAREAETGPATGEGFTPPFETLTIGQVSGGTAVNILARTCRFAFDFRYPPGRDPMAALAPFFQAADLAHARLQARGPGCGVVVSQRSGTPALAPEPDGEAEAFARRITGDNARRLVSFGAEAGQFQEAGMSTIICGPGSIEQAHQPDEWIAVSELSRGVNIFDKLVASLC